MPSSGCGGSVVDVELEVEVDVVVVGEPADSPAPHAASSTHPTAMTHRTGGR